MLDWLEVLQSRPDAADWREDAVWQVGEAKWDGFRMAIVKAGGSIRAVGRKLDLDWWPLLSKHAELRAKCEALPDGTVMDGELHLDLGVPATEVRTCLHDDIRVSTLQYSPFALPMYCGDDMRPLPLVQARWLMTERGFTPPPTIFNWSAEFDPAAAHAQARRLRLEGFVLKAGHWSGWWKVKPVRTLDAFVLAAIHGTGRNTMRLGKLMLGVTGDGGRTVCIGSVGTGFTDVERERPLDSWVGRVVEVQFDSVAARGRLRFPAFLRLRDDKEPAQCLAAQLGASW